MAKFLRSLTICLTLLCFSTIASAQLVGGSAFLQGCYIEVAVADCGVYGSAEAVPAMGPYGVYHPDAPVGLGFVADHEKDGWGTSSPGQPPYCGDYFTPGTPEEGWAIQHGPSVWINHFVPCGGGGSFDIPGSVTAYSSDGGFKTATWEGSIDAMDLSVTQKTIFPDGAVYFLTTVTLCNDGATDLTDVYYMRNMDPDQDQPICGTFQTVNTVVYNPPVGDTALVSAIGDACHCYLGIGAIDSTARASFGNFFTYDGTPEEAWSGAAGGYTGSGSTDCDCAVQLTFKVDIPAGECRELKYAHVLDQSDLAEALLATTGAVGVYADGVDISATGTVALCSPGDTINLQILGADAYTWTWTPDYAIYPDTGTSVFVYPDTTTTYTAVGTGAACGDVYKTVTIIIDTLEHADAGEDAAICLGFTTPLTADGGAGADLYNWDPATGLSCSDCPDPIASPTTTTTYHLTTYDIFGCPAVDNVTVTVYPLPVVDAGDDESFCIDGEVQLNATGALTYSWSPPDGLSCTDCPDPVTTVDVATTYTVTGTDGNGCEDQDDVTVSVDFLPIVSAGPDQTINIVLGESATLEGSGGVSYSWAPSTGLSCTDCQNPVAQPMDTTTYYVTVTDANGCVNIDSVTIFVIGYFDMNLPTAFSPNGDGNNDFYLPITTGYGHVDDFEIYNRWGELVFQSSDPDQGWDGSYNGKEQEVGTYVVVVHATVLEAKKIFQGNFTLIR